MLRHLVQKIKNGWPSKETTENCQYEQAGDRRKTTDHWNRLLTCEQSAAYHDRRYNLRSKEPEVVLYFILPRS